MDKIEVQTQSRLQMVDITEEICNIAEASGVKEGLCFLFVPQTTAGVTISENADPSVSEDIMNTIEKLVPSRATYLQAEGNAAAHIKSVLVGQTLTLPIHAGKILLGTWQGIFLCEFDGPRKRVVSISFLQS